MSNKTKRVTRNLAFIGLASAAVVAGAYYYFDRIRPDREQVPSRPNPDLTTAPTGGVKVDLPETPMTNVPSAPPVAEDKKSDGSVSKQKVGSDDLPLPTGK
ncbi:MAG: hypothetical protein O9293_12610 [Porphyrobacter sp.]|nr:hypothetical protein [Porphyrobacter sp.]